jgi:hypothetical protein
MPLDFFCCIFTKYSYFRTLPKLLLNCVLLGLLVELIVFVKVPNIVDDPNPPLRHLLRLRQLTQGCFHILFRAYLIVWLTEDKKTDLSWLVS